MNTRFANIGALLLLPGFAGFAAGQAAQVQTIEPPPIKMGLWQTETNTSVAGLENTPMARAAGKHSSVTQGCLTPDRWKSDFEKMSNPSSDCKTSNVQQDSHSISADMTCTNDRYTSNAHFEGLIDSDESVHGTANIRLTAQGMPQAMTMQMSFTSHYLGASCGDVKPGEGKIISRQ